MRYFHSIRVQIMHIAVASCIVVMFSTSVCMAEDLKRIILLETMDVQVVRERSHWFQVQMEELGYREGVNMTLSVLKANGNSQLAESLLQAALAEETPELVVTNATLASKAGAKLLQGTNIPQLFMTVTDPVGAGLVEQIGVPSGRNITGRVHNISRETKIKLVLQMIGDKVETRPIRFGYIYSSYPSSVGDLRQLNAIAENDNNITFVPYEIQYREFPDNIGPMLKELSIGLKQLEGKIDFLWEPLGPFAESVEYNTVVQAQASVPVVFGVNKKSARLGALMFLAPDPEAEGREVGVLADKILQGALPGDIPVIPPLKFTLGINLTSARNMNIVVHPDILKLAGKNLYR